MFTSHIKKILCLSTSPQINTTQSLPSLSRNFSPKLLVSFVALTAILSAPAAYCVGGEEKEGTIVSGKRKSPEKTEKQEKGKEKEEEKEGTKRARIEDATAPSSNQSPSLGDAPQENGEEIDENGGSSINNIMQDLQSATPHDQQGIGGPILPFFPNYVYNLDLSAVQRLRDDQYPKVMEEGNAASQYNLGFQYDQDHFAPNTQKSIALFQRSADQGYAQAQEHLGDVYLNGKGVQKNVKKAIGFFERAADQGNTIAIHQLARLYYTGTEVPMDKEKAIFYWKKLSDLGSALAQIQLGDLYSTSTELDYKKAAEYYALAANKKDIDAKYSLGIMYEEGKGVPEDAAKAVQNFRQGAYDDEDDEENESNEALIEYGEKYGQHLKFLPQI